MRRESLRAVHIHHLAAAAPHLLPQFHVCVGEVREGTRVRLQVAARRRPADRQRTCATRWDAGVRPAAAARRAARRATAAPSQGASGVSGQRAEKKLLIARPPRRWRPPEVIE